MRRDVWALGAIAYQALVGDHPYAAPRMGYDQLAQALRERAHRPLEELGIEASVAQVIERALAPEDHRWRSVSALARALRDVAGLSPSQSHDGDEDDESTADTSMSSGTLPALADRPCPALRGSCRRVRGRRAW